MPYHTIQAFDSQDMYGWCTGLAHLCRLKASKSFSGGLYHSLTLTLIHSLTGHPCSRAIQLSQNDGVYTRDLRTGEVHIVMGPTVSHVNLHVYERGR